MKMIVVALLLAAATPAQAQTVHTLENSPNPADRMHARWYATHGMNNQQPDTRSYDERFPSATPGKKLDCDISHDPNTNINTINSCHYVPR